MKLTRTITAAFIATVLLSVSLAWAADQPAPQSASPTPTASAMSEHHVAPAPSMPTATAMPMPMRGSGQTPMMMCLMPSSMLQMMTMNARMGPGMSDQNFVLMTIMHDQMTIQLAKAELQSGKDGKVKAAARSIISRYTSEIAQLKALISS